MPVAQTWSIFLPEGTRISSSGLPTTYTQYPLFYGVGTSETITDKNGNNIFITPSCSSSGPCTTTITDDLSVSFPSRTIVITYGASTDSISWPGAPQGVPSSPTNTTLSASISHSNVGLANQPYQCDWGSSSTNCNANSITLLQVSSISLPPAQTGGAALSYTFGYTCASGCLSVWGNLRTVTLPSGATVNYLYGRDPLASTSMFTSTILENVIKQKTVTYTHPTGDISQNSLVTMYSFTYPVSGPGTTVVTTPDNASTMYWFFNATDPTRGGLIYEVDNPDNSTIQYEWLQNAPFGSPANVPANPYIKATGRTLLDGRHTGTVYTRDKNGNMMEVDDYDWLTPDCAHGDLCLPSDGTALTGIPGTPLRQTVNQYYNGTYAADNTVTDNSNAYWNTTAPQYQRALQWSVVHDISSGAVSLGLVTTGAVVAATVYDYDNRATTANLNSRYQWDSQKGTYGTLTTGNAIYSTWVYTGSGNLASATDPNGNVTQITYDAHNLYPVQVVTAGLRTTNYNYNLVSGFLLSSTDVDNSVATTYSSDLIGRQIKAEQSGGVLDRVSTTTFDDLNLVVTSKQDQASTNDLALVTTTYFDPLGRRRLTIDPAGGHIQKGYFYSTCDCAATYELTSNPYITTNDMTMGWTVGTKITPQAQQPMPPIPTVAGRYQIVGYSSGATPPISFSGSTTTAPSTPYDQASACAAGQACSVDLSDTAYVADEAGNNHCYQVDGLGRVTNADGTNSPCTNGIGYIYDALDNVIRVGSRQFTYSSLSRLTSASNLESGTVYYQYDNNGNLVLQKDANNVSTCFGTWSAGSCNTSTTGYDGLNRPRQKTYSDSTPTVTYKYDHTGDTIGTLYSVSTSASTTVYTHDKFGRVTGSTQTTQGTSSALSFSFVYTYNLADFQTSIQYPSGRKITYTPDSANRVSAVADLTKPNAYASNIQYAAAGAITQITLGNGLAEGTDLNTRLQTSAIALCAGGTCARPIAPSSQNKFVSQLGYSSAQNNGNVTSQQISAPGWSGPLTQTYTYDTANINRIATLTESGTSNWAQTFGYDANGNRYVSAMTRGRAQAHTCRRLHRWRQATSVPPTIS